MSPHEKGGENLSRGEISPHDKCREKSVMVSKCKESSPHQILRSVCD